MAIQMKLKAKKMSLFIKNSKKRRWIPHSAALSS